MKKKIAIAGFFIVITAIPFLWPGVLSVRGTGGWSTAGIELLVFPILLALAFWVLRVIVRASGFLEGKKSVQSEDLSAQITLGIIIGGLMGLWLGNELRMYGFELAAERAEPLIEAIEIYTHDNGVPPESLPVLVPKYITELPQKLPPLEIVTDPEKLLEYGENPWALTALVSRGLLNWDRFIYFPDQDYPERGFGGGIERVSDWAYVHE